ncbi:FliM/FliN family flagellar motor switch protein [Candidatus Liberibacter sp.]|uniref:FliM/FliN family flagellar motor switch protein n=1 Tax=Candidatus Liberibacter sp. TaxID=34022 RepID=UPI0015F422EA|nr:FliM/FliN family flagellar motor switch protein [Candidatus Liberibacter sp.]MBA5723617.1 FliM/FliN family flagellar motor switch protein [Candidatus Liberibacter sp.]
MRGKSTGRDYSPFPPILLARLTGKLGDRKTLERISSNFGHLYAEFLPATFKRELGIDASISYADCKSGKFSQILNSFKENFIFYNASSSRWSSSLFIGCSNSLVITLLEHLLSADQAITKTSSQNRPLSTIEINLAQLILTKISSVLNQCLSDPQDIQFSLEGPYDTDHLRQNTIHISNDFFTAINIEITIEEIVFLFTCMIPQEILLKTKLLPTPPIREESPNSLKQSNDQLTDKTYRLYVDIETRISLQSIPIKDILQFKVGQIIPFLDKDNPRILVNINGKETYSCEFGRIGRNYTARIKDIINNQL